MRNGGTAILSETPEIYGAEHLLTRRAATPEIGRKLVDLIHWWEDYAARNGGEMNNNPSPGNKAGGLTTILEKSLGAAAKGGTTVLNDVYRYAEPVTAKGFVFMDTPGYDPVSATGQVAGGANVIAFTTGRGSAFGCKPTPSIKLATNSDMYRRMERGHGHQLRRRARRRDDRRKGPGDLRQGPRGRVGRAQQVGSARLRRRRIRALADRRGDVTRRDVTAALLFDLDGTLVDSDAAHLRAFQRVFAAARHRRRRARDYVARDPSAPTTRAIGRDVPAASERSRAEATLDGEGGDAIATISARSTPIAGVERAARLRRRRAACSCAVVTNAPRANAELVLGALGLAARLPHARRRRRTRARQARPAALSDRA